MSRPDFHSMTPEYRRQLRAEFDWHRPENRKQNIRSKRMSRPAVSPLANTFRRTQPQPEPTEEISRQETPQYRRGPPGPDHHAPDAASGTLKGPRVLRIVAGRKNATIQDGRFPRQPNRSRRFSGETVSGLNRRSQVVIMTGPSWSSATPICLIVQVFFLQDGIKNVSIQWVKALEPRELGACK